MKCGRLVITDHALVRYLERVCGLDVEAAKRGLAKSLEERADDADPDDLHESCKGIGLNGFVYKLRGNRVATVVPRNKPEAGPKPKRDLP